MLNNQMVTAILPWEDNMPSESRVLVIDDNKEVRKTINYALTSYGFEIFECDNATEALSLAMRESFDYIITDFDMPGMNGIDLVRRLRAILPPLVVIIGMSGDDVSRRFLEEGANDFLMKPFVPYRLAMMIDGGDIAS